MTTAIVGCTKSKIDTDSAVPARDLYDSTYFDKRMRVAKQYDNVRILSAKHGILNPDEKIEQYDHSLYDMTASERRAMASELDTSGLDGHVVVYAGSLYVKLVERAVPDTTPVDAPLTGRIGEQLSQLNDMIERDGE